MAKARHIGYISEMKRLPKELKDLVRTCGRFLGEEIKERYGAHIYDKVEKIRRLSNETRSLPDKIAQEKFEKIYRILAKEQSEDLLKIAHSYSLYLELVNRCESAYRSFRLKTKDFQFKKVQGKMIYVFTSHPTESRNLESLKLFKKIEQAIEVFLTKKNEEVFHEEISLYLGLLMLGSLYKKHRPSVKNEADLIFSQVLSLEILDKQVGQKLKGNTVEFRSWSGGDKDGHPFVDDNSLLHSWQMSRKRLIRYLRVQLNDLLYSFSLSSSDVAKNIHKHLRTLDRHLLALSAVKSSDGDRVKAFLKKLESIKSLLLDFGLKLPYPFLKIEAIVELYPALVVPMEIREDSEEVGKVLGDLSAPISRMIKLTKRISEGGSAHSYVRGFVLSMVKNHHDVENGFKLVKKICGNYSLRVIPLFETESALGSSTEILEQFFRKNPDVLKNIKKNQNSLFEVMLGYSDSSKENGLLRGKYLIFKSIKKIDHFLKSYQLIPVFFHGSGGSVERGGGSVKEQISWWPKSARNIYKVTVQGEMVTRNFGSPYIMKSQIYKINNERSEKFDKEKLLTSAVIQKVSKLSSQYYKEMISSPDFIDIVKFATPYSFLDLLKIGSRPNKRAGGEGSSSLKLRAIPWVLCWTQCRVLFPSWWGIGSSYDILALEEKEILRAEFISSAFVRSFIRVLGFTMEKVELSIFEFYLGKLFPDQKIAKRLIKEFRSELKKTKKFAREVSGKHSFLWHRPWLKESITYRSSMIHPLNILQIIAIEKNDKKLLQETIVGIACGMMTTG